MACEHLNGVATDQGHFRIIALTLSQPLTRCAHSNDQCRFGRATLRCGNVEMLIDNLSTTYDAKIGEVSICSRPNAELHHNETKHCHRK